LLRRHWVALGYATGSNLGVRERRGRVGYCGCYFPPWTYKKCELNATLLYQHGGGIVMVRAPYMGLRNCVKAGVHLHPAVSVISSSLTMSGTVTTAVLGVSDLVRLRASQLRRCRAGGYWGLPLLCRCPCAVVAWRPQHESPLLLSPRGERDLFADLPILGGQCCDLESHRCAGRHRGGRCSSIIARTLACKQVAAVLCWRLGNYPPPCRYFTTPGPAVFSFVGAWGPRIWYSVRAWLCFSLYQPRG